MTAENQRSYFSINLCKFYLNFTVLLSAKNLSNCSALLIGLSLPKIMVITMIHYTAKFVQILNKFNVNNNVTRVQYVNILTLCVF